MEGRPSELESQNGGVVRLGQDAGVATPVHRFIYHSLLPLELRARARRIGFPELRRERLHLSFACVQSIISTVLSDVQCPRANRSDCVFCALPQAPQCGGTQLCSTL
jgi:hypothetical protein